MCSAFVFCRNGIDALSAEQSPNNGVDNGELVVDAHFVSGDGRYVRVVATLAFRWWWMLTNCMALFALACSTHGWLHRTISDRLNCVTRVLSMGAAWRAAADPANREDSGKSIKFHQREGGGRLKTQRRVAALVDGSHLT